ncbi:MAG: 3-deoxy-7-phosphoheptulonate synthase [Planctomycetes bacterium]|nr:3-deoxy-7-phosphoheptulonate synthase [Planctomycetota bacterium]MBT4028892.1 3-deoxy-7-phosphoheptulonate synthase [Planctomycetota bacterium]
MIHTLQVVLHKGLAQDALADEARALDGVRAVLTPDRPCFRVSLQDHDSTVIKLGEGIFGGSHAAAIAGPCSVEDFDSLITLAHKLKKAGATALRGGAFKPRTSPYNFQGLGQKGLEILDAVRRESGLPVVTEVMDTRDIGLVAQHADCLQIGSRNMMNYSLLKEAGRAGMPVLLKRGMSATLEEFVLAAEYLADGGCTEILLCERGLRHFDPAMRNLLDLSAVPALKERTHLPVVVDPSHGTGRASLVPSMMAAAAAAGADGFLIEVHPQPAESISDAGQALSFDEFENALQSTSAVLTAMGRTLSVGAGSKLAMASNQPNPSGAISS